jgi:aspartate racemase
MAMAIESEDGVKTIGLLGGMSWESSSTYYRIINTRTRDLLGGLHSARSIMYSIDFAEMEMLQDGNRWEEAGRMLIDAALRVERGGADFIVICTNTMHKLADDVQRRVQIPLLHIADATATRIKAAGLQTVALLGTRFTMEEDFYKGRLVRNHGLAVLTPEYDDRQFVHAVIYGELCAGRIETDSKRRYLDIMGRLAGQGAEGVILGCTEIGLLVQQADSAVPLFDTALIHAEAAVDYALA